MEISYSWVVQEHSQICWIISKFRHYVITDILISIYYSLVYGHLIHGIEIWCLTYATYLKSIMQKKAIRIMSFSDPRSHSQAIFKSLDIVKFHDLIKYHILKFVFHWKIVCTLQLVSLICITSWVKGIPIKLGKH